MGRTETDRKITSELWSSMQEEKGERKRKRKALSGEKKEVCSESI
jgi:hypothetical protein